MICLSNFQRRKRLAFFEQISKPKELDFVTEIDGIYYVVLSHFDNAKDENMVEKVRRIVLKTDSIKSHALKC